MKKQTLAQKLHEEENKQIIEENLERWKKEEALKPFSDGLPYNKERLIFEGKMFCDQTARGMFGLGCVLIALRENETWKEVLRIAKEHYGISKTTTCRFMSRARKMIHRPKLVPALGPMNDTQISTILELPDDDLDEIESEISTDGTILGKPVEELQLMTTRELQSFANRHKNKTDKLEKEKEGLIREGEKKDREIDELKEKLKGQVVSGDVDKVNAALSDVRFQVYKAINQFMKKINWQMSEVTINEAAGTVEVLRSATEDLFERFADELKGLRREGLFEDVNLPALHHTRELKHETDMQKKAAALKKKGKGAK